MSKLNRTELARELRKNQTVAEALLWRNLRGKKFHGIKFYRQHPIVFDKPNGLFYIVDFYSKTLNLVIEVDGEIHEFQKEYDLNRTGILENLGLRVIRFENTEVVQNVSGVLEILREMI